MDVGGSQAQFALSLLEEEGAGEDGLQGTHSVCRTIW